MYMIMKEKLPEYVAVSHENTLRWMIFHSLLSIYPTVNDIPSKIQFQFGHQFYNSIPNNVIYY